MTLFNNCNLPKDERALEILDRISALWEENLSTKIQTDGLTVIGERTYHQRVSRSQKEALIDLSVNSPHLLEEQLDAGEPLCSLLYLANQNIV